jgi:restriction endonuclease Mrr
MLPKTKDVEVPLLSSIEKLGGKARAHEVYPEVTKHFKLSEADLAEQLPSGGDKWTNRIQWARQRLIEHGELSSPGHGIWAITDKGLARLHSEAKPADKSDRARNEIDLTKLSFSESVNLEEISEEYVQSFKKNVLQKLNDLKPKQFEEFAGALLKGYGFRKILITGKTGDGGIDGHGQLKVGLAVVNAAFQCKKWQDSVGPKEVQAFRGAIQGQFEQGYFFTTSRFTKRAQEESLKPGAAPVFLFEGDQIVDIMMEKEVGVRRRPVEIYEDQIELLFETE